MNSVKLTLNLPKSLVDQLKKESERNHTTLTETIRKGLETELFLTKEEESGSKILLERKNQKIVEIMRR